MCYINSAKHLKQRTKHYLGVIKMVVDMTDQEHRDLDVLLATLPQLPNEAKAYLKGYAQAMADQNKEKEERPA